MPVLLPVVAFLKQHWRGAAVVAGLLVAFCAGRLTGHRPVVTKTTTIATVTQAKSAEQKTAVDVEVKQADTEKHDDRITKIDTVTKKPDGTMVETKEEIDDVSGVDARSLDDSARMASDTKTAQSTTHQTETQAITVAPHASDAPLRESPWELTLGAGVPVKLGAPFVGEPFGMVELSRTVGHVPFLGWPLYMGVWFDLDFDGKNPTVGGSVGVGLPGLP